MSQDDDLTAKLLADAESRASAAGRSDVADYLQLRLTNDALRKAGVTWLIGSFIDVVAPYMQHRPRLAVERSDGHRFSHGSATMIGSLLDMRHGVRCLTVEAGWVRGPGDGIMRDGALAVAYVRHFGLPKATQLLKLSLSEQGTSWLDEKGGALTAASIEPHISLFLEL